MQQKLPTAMMEKKTGYGVDSVQKRLGEIVYVELNPDEMMSRQGRHLEAQRDQVQMMGIGELLVKNEDGSTALEAKTYNKVKADAAIAGRKRPSIDDVSDDDERRNAMISNLQKIKEEKQK